MFKYWPIIRESTIFKLSVAAAVSFIMYELAVVLLPIFLAIFLAFALYPLANIIGKVKVGKGTIHLSRVVAIILAFFTILVKNPHLRLLHCCLLSSQNFWIM